MVASSGPEDFHPVSLRKGFLVSQVRISPPFLGDLRWVARFEPNRCEPNRSTYRQRLPKVCQQQFHGQDEN